MVFITHQDPARPQPPFTPPRLHIVPPRELLRFFSRFIRVIRVIIRVIGPIVQALNRVGYKVYHTIRVIRVIRPSQTPSDDEKACHWTVAWDGVSARRPRRF